jgi:GDP-L-fucose synthase
MMEKDSKIFVAGQNGLVGSAITRKLVGMGHANIVKRGRAELDLLDQSAVKSFFSSEKPDYVFMAGARVGGIYANSTYPASFIYENLQIQNNVINEAYLNKTKKLLFLGSSCIYPKFAPQPMKEEYLLSATLEPTNEPYAIAKIAGIVMVRAYRRQYGCDFISLMPTNLYGVGDNFDLNNSHVLPALLRKFHDAKTSNAKSVTVWGTGSALREFLHVDDLAEACVFTMNNYSSDDFLNVGSGKEISIKGLAELIKDIVGFDGELIFDHTKPDGTPRKLLDIGKIKKVGWEPRIELKEGIEQTYKWYLDSASNRF